MKKNLFQFKILRSSEIGIKKALFDLEAEIMEYVWSLEAGEFSVRGVLKQLEKKRKIAYTTVMTTVERLWHKGLLQRTKKGKSYYYSVKMSKHDFLDYLTHHLISSLPEGGQEPLFSHFIEIISQVDSEQLSRLEALLEKRKAVVKNAL